MAEVTVWYLAQAAPGTLSEPRPRPDLQVHEARVKQFQFNRFLYQLVGGPWQWTDKLRWSDDEWRAYAERDGLRTWAAWVEGSPAGYFELERLDDESVDIRYFGLAEKFIGRGLGRTFLTHALWQAWQWDAQRVTVNTCTLDHPRALDNYRKQGFEITRTEVTVTPDP